MVSQIKLLGSGGVDLFFEALGGIRINWESYHSLSYVVYINHLSL